MRKLKREAQSLPFSEEFNRIISISEEQYRLRMKLRDLMVTQGGNSETVAELSKEIENLTQEHEKLVQQAQKQYPDAKIPAFPPPTHQASIMQNLSDNDAVILWAVDDYGSKAIVITKQRVHTVSLPIDLADMEQLVNDIRKTLDQPDTRSAMDIRPFSRETAYRLYQEVFEPLNPYIQGKTKLYLLPDGPLAKLPLQVLPTKLPDHSIKSPLDFINYRAVSWLGDSYEMSYQPSLNNLHDQLTSGTEKSTTGSHAMAYAGFGNPVMPGTINTNTGAELLSATRENIGKLRQHLQSTFDFMGDNTLESLSNLAPLPKTEEQLNRVHNIMITIFG